MNFKTWLLHFKNVDRPIGDLANDIAKDSAFPSGNDRDVIRDYLESRAGFSVSTALLKTFDDAWDYYLKDTK